jgi:hypothetical protein
MTGTLIGIEIKIMMIKIIILMVGMVSQAKGKVGALMTNGDDIFRKEQEEAMRRNLVGGNLEDNLGGSNLEDNLGGSNLGDNLGGSNLMASNLGGNQEVTVTGTEAVTVTVTEATNMVDMVFQDKGKVGNLIRNGGSIFLRD